MKFPIIARSVQALEELTTPGGGIGQSQAVPWVLYDTQTYVDNTTLSLTYFGAVVQDKTLSNMEIGGSIPKPKYFEIFAITVDPIIEPSSAAAAVGAWNDMGTLMQEQRPTFEYEMQDKNLGPFPLSFFHQSGGVRGFGFNLVALGAVAEEYANWGVEDGGFWVGGSIIIPPTTGFSVTLRWAAVANISADTLIRVNLHGVMHRAVI